MKITAQGTGRLLDEHIYIGNENVSKVNLRLEKGPQMGYNTTPAEYIDFPGEYDIDGVTVVCIEADKKLSYTIKTGDETVALIQNAAVLEVANFESIDTRVCADANIKQEIENLELEGDIMVLGEENTA